LALASRWNGGCYGLWARVFTGRRLTGRVDLNLEES
jgi:hypothetical protein